MKRKPYEVKGEVLRGLLNCIPPKSKILPRNEAEEEMVSEFVCNVLEATKEFAREVARNAIGESERGD